MVPFRVVHCLNNHQLVQELNTQAVLVPFTGKVKLYTHTHKNTFKINHNLPPKR